MNTNIILIQNQAQFDKVAKTDKIIRPTNQQIKHYGKTYDVLLRTEVSFSKLTLLAKRILALGLILISLGAVFFFHNSKNLIIELYHSKRTYLLVKKKVSTTKETDSDQRLPVHSTLKPLKHLENGKGQKVFGLNVYAICNETNLNAVYKKLKNQPIKKDAAHIGCAGWYNFNIIATRNSEYGIIFDVNADSIRFMKKTLECLLKYENKTEFENEMLSYMLNEQKKNPKTFFEKHNFKLNKTIELEDTISRELASKKSWLYDNAPERYNHLRRLAKEGKLLVIHQDIQNSSVFEEIKNALTKENCSIDTVYLSNISNFMSSKEEKNKLTKSIKTLLDNDSLLVHSPLRKTKDKYDKVRIHQIVSKGKEIQRNDKLLWEQ